MTLLQKRPAHLLLVVLAAAALGRLAVRGVLNLLLGGTLFGGTSCEQDEKEGAAHVGADLCGGVPGDLIASAAIKLT